MRQKFILFQLSGIFYCEAVHQPAMNLQIAQVSLQHGDPALVTRTRQDVTAQIAATKTGSTQRRWQVACGPWAELPG